MNLNERRDYAQDHFHFAHDSCKTNKFLEGLFMNFVPQLNYVSEEQIEKLHQYGMGILKNSECALRIP